MLEDPNHEAPEAMIEDPMQDVPEAPTRYPNRVPWGIIFLLALIPIGALIALALMD